MSTDLDYIAGMLRMFAAAAQIDVDKGIEGAKSARNFYNECAQILEEGGDIEDLPPLGRATVATIQEGAP